MVQMSSNTAQSIENRTENNSFRHDDPPCPSTFRVIQLQSLARLPCRYGCQRLSPRAWRPTLRLDRPASRSTGGLVARLCAVKYSSRVMKSKIRVMKGPFRPVKTVFRAVKGSFRVMKSQNRAVKGPFRPMNRSFRVMKGSFRAVKCPFWAMKSPVRPVKSPFNTMKSIYRYLK
jgi:hypothetical protein